MKQNFLKLLPAVFFIIAGGLAGFYERDYLEMLMWFCFAAAVVVPLLPIRGVAPEVFRLVAIGFSLLGLALLLFGVWESF